MKINKVGNSYAFSFGSVSDVVEYNDWLEEIGLDHACVRLPMGVTSRQLRRLTTKSPSILKCLDHDATERLEERWGLA